MPRLFTATLLFLSLWAASASAQTPDPVLGDWRGVLNTPQGELTLVVQITSTKGVLAGVLDSPDQGGPSISLTVSEPAPKQLRLEAPDIAGRFTGEWSDSAGGWSGVWSQSGYNLPLVLRRVPHQPATAKSAP